MWMNHSHAIALSLTSSPTTHCAPNWRLFGVPPNASTHSYQERPLHWLLHLLGTWFPRTSLPLSLGLTSYSEVPSLVLLYKLATLPHPQCAFAHILIFFIAIDHWVREIPWRRKWQPTSIFLPGKSHGQRSLACYSPWVATVGHDLVTNLHHHTIQIQYIYLICLPLCTKMWSSKRQVPCYHGSLVYPPCPGQRQASIQCTSYISYCV